MSELIATLSLENCWVCADYGSSGIRFFFVRECRNGAYLFLLPRDNPIVVCCDMVSTFLSKILEIFTLHLWKRSVASLPQPRAQPFSSSYCWKLDFIYFQEQFLESEREKPKNMQVFHIWYEIGSSNLNGISETWVWGFLRYHVTDYWTNWSTRSDRFIPGSDKPVTIHMSS
jgi:hypothetical protein